MKSIGVWIVGTTLATLEMATLAAKNMATLATKNMATLADRLIYACVQPAVVCLL